MSAKENFFISSTAAQLMAIEVLTELLVSTSPQKLGEVLTNHLRELSGARTVMILAHRPEPELHELLYVSPLRRADIFSPTEFSCFYFEHTPGELPNSTEEFSADHPLKAVLAKAGIRSMARYPLRAGGEMIGMLLLFDLPDVQRIGEINLIINHLAPPIALALKNSLAFFKIEQLAQELEQRVEERTAELRQTQALFQAAMDCSPAGIAIADAPDGTLRYVNDAGLLMRGADRQSIVNGVGIDEYVKRWQLFDLDGRQLGIEEVPLARAIMFGETNSREMIIRRSEGDDHIVLANAAPIKDDSGKVQAGIVVFTDITEHKRSDLELQENRKLYRNLVEGTPDLITRVDTDGRFVFVNHTALQIYGLPPEGCIGRLAFDFVHPDDRESTAAAFNTWLQSSEEILTHENRQVGIDGQGQRYMMWTIRAERDENGAITGFSSSARDMTESRQNQEEKDKLEAQLQQAQKMESVGRLAGGVAHDFNNMLGVILGHAELGLMRLEPTHPACANLKEISRTAERSADLTRQLLAFARKQTVVPKVLDLNVSLTEMLKMLQRLIGEDIRLNWHPSPGLWQVRMDPSQVDQILANLCVNARDAIDGTGSITIETANSTVDAEYCLINREAAPGEYVRLTVSDSGSGMDKETQSHVFEPFFTTKELGKGTGLGLATVYGAVRQNNGFINIYSEAGQGTTFSIYLPRDTSSRSGGAGSKAAVAPVSYGQETILLVEDEPAILDVASTMLEMQGYTVLKADNPGEAIRLAREHSGQIQLLMTDVIMPEMNGRDLAKSLLSIYPDMKRLFMSGYTADVIANHGVLEEGVHFIQKPFSLSDMAAKVRVVLDSN